MDDNVGFGHAHVRREGEPVPNLGVVPEKREGGKVKYDPNPGREPRTVPLARVTIDRPQRFDRAGRRNVANWLVKEANDLATIGELDYTGYDFRGRYRYERDGQRRTAAKLVVRCAGALSYETRQRIARWLLSRAAWVRKHSRTCGEGRWWTQEFAL